MHSLKTIVILSMLLASVSVVQAAKPEGSGGNQLGQLGGSLKAAVLSGSMTEEDARAIWESAIEVEKLQEEMESLLAPETREVGEDAKSQTLRLIPPDPREPRLLLQPEFLERDGVLVIEAMELDEQRAEIVDLVFRDYAASYELLSQPLLVAMRQYRRAEVGRDLADAVERLDRQLTSQDIDMKAAMATMQGRLEDYAREAVAKRGEETEEGREKARAMAREWVQELGGGLDSLDDNMNRLRDRLVSAIDEMEQAGDDVTAADLQRLALQLRRQRDSIRSDVLQTLRMTIVEDGDAPRLARLDAAMQRLQFRAGLRLARLGGERIDPRAVLEGSMQGGEPERTRLEEMEPALSELSRARMDAAIDRELAGVKLMVDVRRAIDEHGGEEFVPADRWEAVIDPYADAWHRQIDASVACRDGILDAVDELTVVLMEEDVETAFAYRDLALRRGFPDEMRVRWYERAIEAALQLEDLSEEIAAAIAKLRDQVSIEARAIRDRAIEGRMQRDVELAHAPVLSLWGLGDDKGEVFEEADWRGREFEAHRLLNDQVEDSLRVLLTPQQFDALPKRRWQGEDKTEVKKQGGGKGGAKSPGRGSGRGKPSGKGGGGGKSPGKG